MSREIVLLLPELLISLGLIMLDCYFYASWNTASPVLLIHWANWINGQNTSSLNKIKDWNIISKGSIHPAVKTNQQIYDPNCPQIRILQEELALEGSSWRRYLGHQILGQPLHLVQYPVLGAILGWKWGPGHKNASLTAFCSLPVWTLAGPQRNWIPETLLIQ